MPWSDKENAEELLDRLAALVSEHGAERLLSAPLIEATSRCFPDEWQPSLLGLARLVHRLHHLAGLGGYDFVFVDSRPPYADEAEVDVATQQPQVELREREESAFVYEVCSLGAPDLLVGGLCFEVSRAFFEAHRPRDPYRGGDSLDPTSEEAQIRAAVATIYLGFGPLSVAAAHSYRASGELAGAYAVTRWSHTRVGALPAGDMTFLFAVQLALRGLDDEACKQLFAEFGDNQRADMMRWLGMLRGETAALEKRLGLPAVTAAPAAPAAPLQVEGLPAVPALDEDIARELEEAEEAYRHPLAEMTVPRFYTRRTLAFGMVGVAAGCVAFTLGMFVVGSSIAAFAAGVVCVGVGLFLGRGAFAFTCSACGMNVATRAERCHRCGAHFEGQQPLPQTARVADMVDDDDDDELAAQALAASSFDRPGLFDGEDEEDEASPR